MSQRPAPPFDLIVITEPTLADPVELVRRMLTWDVGFRVAVQLRAKVWEPSQRRQAAFDLRAITLARNALLILNSDPSLCRDVKADGVQLPASGPSIQEARRVLTERMWIGTSCHCSEDLVRAATEGADFTVLSPWATVPGKAPPLGSEGFQSLADNCALPIYALGGITLNDIGEAVGHGAHGIAVIRDLHHAPDPANWLRRALAAIDSARGIH